MMHPEFCWTESEALSFLQSIGRKSDKLPEADIKCPKPLWSRLNICRMAIKFLEKASQRHAVLAGRGDAGLMNRTEKLLTRMVRVKLALAAI
ncbi:MAG: hypothetical protein ACJ8FY_16320 [Gemmataceae bacterium]